MYCSSPVDMQSYELCCDMIDVVIDVSCIYGYVLPFRVLSGDFFLGGKHGLVWSASGGCYKGVKHVGNGLVWSGGCIRGLSEYPCEYALPV